MNDLLSPAIADERGARARYISKVVAGAWLVILAGGFVATLTLSPAQAVICTDAQSSSSGGAGDDGFNGTNTACGQGANASGDVGAGNTAVGNGADAHSTVSSSGSSGQSSSGNGASSGSSGQSSSGAGPIESHNTATGDNAFAYGDGSVNTANGAYSDAHGDGSDNSAFGSLSQAWGAGSSNNASGDQANASGDNSANAAFGATANASGNDSANLAVGNGAYAAGDGWRNTAVGAGARAEGANSSAFGAGAVATIAGQQMFGTPDNTYTFAGINSQASKDAQSGSTYFVTSDASGNLATTSMDLSPLTGLGSQIKTVGALSAALAGLHPNSRATGDNQLSGAVGMYNGQVGAAVGYYRNFGNNALLSVGAATSNGDTMTNAGVTLSW
ncbi:MAG TPA: YadA-like family protein [Bauldia sp.]|nr:YadA-like family protein [Bauldia sp.]